MVVRRLQKLYFALASVFGLLCVLSIPQLNYVYIVFVLVLVPASIALLVSLAIERRYFYMVPPLIFLSILVFSYLNLPESGEPDLPANDWRMITSYFLDVLYLLTSLLALFGSWWRSKS